MSDREQAEPSLRRLWRLLAGLLLSAGLLWGLWAWAERHQADWAAVTRAPWTAWAWLVGCLLVSYALRASRMHAELSAQQAVPWARIALIALVHNAAVNALPLRSGELAYPMLLRKHLGLPLAMSAISLAWMRAQDLWVLLALAWLAWAPLPWSLKALGLVLAAGLTVWGYRWARQRWAVQQAPPTPGWGDHLQRALGQLLAPAKHAPGSWLYCVGNWVVKLAGIAGFLLASLPVTKVAASGAALAGELAALMPLQGPANLGTYEAAVLLGASWSQRAILADLPAVALAMHAALFVLAVVLGLLAWLRLQHPAHGLPHHPPT